MKKSGNLKIIPIVVAMSVVFTTLKAQNIGVRTTSPSTTLDVNGSASFEEGTALTLVNGVNSNVTLGDYSFFRITGPTSAFSIMGFAGGQNGRILTIINATSQTMTLSHQTTSSAANQLNLSNGNPVFIAANGTATFQYNSTLSKWLMIASTAADNSTWSLTGNSGTNASTNFLGTTDATALVFRINSAEAARFNTSRYLGVNNAAPLYRIHAEDPAGLDADIAIRTYVNGASGLPSLQLQTCNGTKAAPTAVVSGQELGTVRFNGYDGAAFNDITSAEVTAFATENWSTTAHGSALRFRVIPNAGTATAVAMTLNQNGFVGIGTETPSATLDVNGGLVTRESATVNLTADNQAVTVGNTSFLVLSSNNGTANNRTFTLSNGLQNGQVLVILLTSSAAELADSGNCNLASAYAMGTGDTIKLIWYGSTWYEIGRSNN